MREEKEREERRGEERRGGLGRNKRIERKQKKREG